MLSTLMALRGRRLYLSITFFVLVIVFYVSTLKQRDHVPLRVEDTVTDALESEDSSFSAPTANKLRPWAGWSNLERIFTFGDSWTSSDFNTFGEQPSLANPIGNPPFPGDVSSVGPNWVGYLTAFYNATPIMTYNLGHGAATIAREVLLPLFPMTYTFEEQVRDKFVREYAAKVDLHEGIQDETTVEDGEASPVALWSPRTTLFAVWVGVVDIALFVREGHDINVLTQLFEKYASIVDMLYANNARNILFLNAPPLDLAPECEDVDLAHAYIEDFNSRLYKLSGNLTATYPDASAWVFDVDTLLRTVLDKSDTFAQTAHLLNLKDSCPEYQYRAKPRWDDFVEKCGARYDEYAWKDPLHPTHVMHDVTAAIIVEECFEVGRKKRGLCH